MHAELLRDRQIAQFHLETLSRNYGESVDAISFGEFVNRLAEQYNMRLPYSIYKRFENKKWGVLQAQGCTALFVGGENDMPTSLADAEATLEVANRFKGYDEELRILDRRIPTMARITDIHPRTRRVVAATYTLGETPSLIEANIPIMLPQHLQISPTINETKVEVLPQEKLFVQIPTNLAGKSYETAGLITERMIDKTAIFGRALTHAIIVHNNSGRLCFGRFGENDPKVAELAAALEYFTSPNEPSVTIGQRPRGSKVPRWELSIPLSLGI